MKLEALAQFETIESMNEEFKKSGFLKINAPAIAFPYVRSYISTITLNSGYAPITYPAVNFVALANEKNE